MGHAQSSFDETCTRENKLKNLPYVVPSNLVTISYPKSETPLLRIAVMPPVTLESALESKKRNPDCVLTAHTNCSSLVKEYDSKGNVTAEYLACRNSEEEMKRIKLLNEKLSKL